MKRSLLLNAVQNAQATLARFFLTFIFALLGTIAVIMQIERSQASLPKYNYIDNLIFVSVVGIGLSISTTLFAERRLANKLHRHLFQLFTSVILVFYFFFLPEIWSAIEFYRALIIFLSLHCLVSFSAFIKRGNLIGFWQFNKTLFIHILISIFYTTVLFSGICLALFSVSTLFNVTIIPGRYGELWVLLIGIFNTWFFLSGIPLKIEELDAKTDYPKGLKVFTQFVLLPLVTIYFVILYIYLAKIIFTWQLPRGIVSYLVLGFSFFGILSLLLVYPLQNLDTEKWIKVYSRWFYFALLPLVVLLFWAIGSRISQYGVTESRYIIVLLVSWLAGISIYLLYTKLQKIKAVPISLCIVGLLSTFGPWSVFNVSKVSQLNRLKVYLEKNKLLVNGKIEKYEHSVEHGDADQISSLITYLNNNHGFESLTSIISPEVLQSFKGADSRRELLKLLNVEQISSTEKNDFSYHVTDDFSTYVVSGYDFLFVDYLTTNDPGVEKSYKYKDEEVFISVTPRLFNARYGKKKVSIDLLQIYEKFNFNSNSKRDDFPRSRDVEYIYEDKEIKLKLTPRALNGRSIKHAEGFAVEYIAFWVGIKFKK